MKDDDSNEIQHELDILDETNPHSLVNLLPGKMGDSLRNIPIEVLTMTETDLKRLGHIGLTEERLRYAFWMEYNFASVGKRVINMPNIYNGVCRREYWWQRILTDSYKMAYIFLPPPAHRVEVRELLNVANQQIRDILMRDHIVRDKEGKDVGTDAKLAGAKVKIYEMLANRVHGAMIQKIQTENKNLNVDVNLDDAKSIEDVEKRIRDAEMRLAGGGVKSLEHEAKDVTPTKKAEMSKVRLNNVAGTRDEDDQK